MADPKAQGGTDSVADAVAQMEVNGYRLVPIRPGSKRPVHTDWRHRRSTPADWRNGNGAGLLGGHGTLPVDIDTEDPEILASIQGALPTMLVTVTGKRGLKTFFRDATGSLKGRKFKDRDGRMLVEILATGQAVVPPSLHPELRRPFAYGTEQTLLNTAADALPEITAAHIEALEKALSPWMAAPKVRTQGKANGARAPSKARMLKYATAALQDEANALAAVGKGGRNRALFDAACKLGKYANQGVLRVGLVEDSLLAACKANGLLHDPDDGEEACRATICSALRKAEGDELPELEEREHPKQQEEAKQQASHAWSSHLTLDAYPERETQFAWWPRLPQGLLSILAGRGGLGKGLVAADFAARTTTGRPWPLSGEHAPRGRVLWFEAEDDIDAMIRPRLTAAGANLKLVEPYLPSDMPGFRAIKEYIASTEVAMLVFSPLNSFLRSLKDINNDTEVRKALEELQDAIRSKNCSALALGHLNKKADLDALDRLLGSVAFVNVSRSVMLVHSEGDSGSDQRRLIHAKWNASVKGPDLLYEVEHTDPANPRNQRLRLKWSLAANQADPVSLFRPETNRSERPSAAAWLFKYLTENGSTLKSTVVRDGRKAGFGVDALEKAHARDPRFTSHKDGFQGPAVWELEGG